MLLHAGGHNEHGQIDTPEGAFWYIAAGDYHTCGMRTDQTITCWGNNEHGQSDAPKAPSRISLLTAALRARCGLMMYSFAGATNLAYRWDNLR